MLKMFIIVKTRFEGWHVWPDAPIEVDFLKCVHRHIFYVEAKIPVSHDDRQLEFFMVKRFIDEFIYSKYPEGKLKSKSCEMLAEEILNTLQSNYELRKGVAVGVYEDGENGAIVES
jgi:hypothetical protein